ncbi:hypothetical protein [Zhihengliuella halotolerans]|uniref:hypothetical protein n=1 Tax=Zhihengliuella halotolerans TaxID=370736 RepID=UPI0011AF3C65|nr:hypothetical protein [Zhihengliuella halotolerans]
MNQLHTRTIRGEHHLLMPVAGTTITVPPLTVERWNALSELADGTADAKHKLGKTLELALGAENLAKIRALKPGRAAINHAAITARAWHLEGFASAQQMWEQGSTTGAGLRTKTVDGEQHLLIPIGDRTVEIPPAATKAREELASLERDVQRIAAGKPGRHFASIRFVRARMTMLALGPVAETLRRSGADDLTIREVTAIAVVWNLRGFDVAAADWREMKGA